jgi:hypothetical protein
MTIDSSWILSFKEEAPEAFTNHIPFRPRAVFCDGQIRLMRGGTDELLTWDDYIWKQFYFPVSKFYRTHGAEVVILAFDDYSRVPEAKCMTQLKRRRHLAKIECLEREPLPPVCPCGARWDQSIANRTFKAKVIAHVIHVLPRLLRLEAHQRLIIDYAGSPTEYTPNPEGGYTETLLSHLCPLGEADIKFPRYAEIYRDVMVDSVDGDSIPIALIHHEAALRDLTMGSMRSADLSDAPPRVCINRITTRLAEDKAAVKQEAKDTGSKITKRTYEFVNIPLLYENLYTVCAQCLGRVQSYSHDAHMMKMLLALIGLTGTDFTRQMPQLSGKTVFNYLPDIYQSLMLSFDTATGQLDIPFATNKLVAGIYSAKFSSHIKTPHATLQSIFDTLSTSKLSQRTLTSLPTVAQISCTIRNVNWVLNYWSDPTRAPSPTALLNGAAVFGYVKQKGLVTYADCVNPDSSGGRKRRVDSMD